MVMINSEASLLTELFSFSCAMLTGVQTFMMNKKCCEILHTGAEV